MMEDLCCIIIMVSLIPPVFNALLTCVADPKIGYAYEKFLFGFNYLDVSSGWPVIVAQ